MKIAIIAHNLYPIAEPYAGGLEKITHLLIDKFVERGHEVYLFGKEGSKTKAHLHSFPSREQFEEQFYDDEHKWLGLTRDEMFHIYTYNCAMNDLHALNCDVIHNHSLHHIPIVRGREFGNKFITTFHTPIFTQLRFGLLCNRNSSKANQYTSISKFQKNLYSEFVESDVIYNGIEVNEWNFEDKNKQDYLFWMGRICKEKAPHHAAQACIKANVELIIAGPKSDEAYFIKELEPLLQNDLITYVGHLEQREINHYLKHAKAYLFTSMWDEPYGLTIAEALSSATPVIGYDVGAVSEIITEETGFIIPKGDQYAMANAIQDLHKIDPIACRKRAESFCNIEVVVDQYLRYYKNLI